MIFFENHKRSLYKCVKHLYKLRFKNKLHVNKFWEAQKYVSI